MEQNESSGMSQEQFGDEEVVWAKIHGYPWWPAYIGSADQAFDGSFIYTVYFFGENTHSILESSKLRKFAAFFTELTGRRLKDKKFLRAVRQAEAKFKAVSDSSANTHYHPEAHRVSAFKRLKSKISPKNSPKNSPKWAKGSKNNQETLHFPQKQAKYSKQRQQFLDSSSLANKGPQLRINLKNEVNEGSIKFIQREQITKKIAEPLLEIKMQTRKSMPKKSSFREQNLSSSQQEDSQKRTYTKRLRPKGVSITSLVQQSSEDIKPKRGQKVSQKRKKMAIKGQAKVLQPKTRSESGIQISDSEINSSLQVISRISQDSKNPSKLLHSLIQAKEEINSDNIIQVLEQGVVSTIGKVRKQSKSVGLIIEHLKLQLLARYFPPELHKPPKGGRPLLLKQSMQELRRKVTKKIYRIIGQNARSQELMATAIKIQEGIFQNNIKMREDYQASVVQFMHAFRANPKAAVLSATQREQSTKTGRKDIIQGTYNQGKLKGWVGLEESVIGDILGRNLGLEKDARVQAIEVQNENVQKRGIQKIGNQEKNEQFQGSLQHEFKPARARQQIGGDLMMIGALNECNKSG